MKAAVVYLAALVITISLMGPIAVAMKTRIDSITAALQVKTNGR